MVNLVVVLVPIAGLEFARIHERQLLSALERDMNNQASLVRALLEADLDRGVPIDDPQHLEVLVEAARETRTRIRLLDRGGQVVVDSHENGPPEGLEAPPPRILGTLRDGAHRVDPRRVDPGPTWPAVQDRVEVRAAMRGELGSHTRVRERDPAVFLFVAQPVWGGDAAPTAVVYAARSTRPVMVELYRIRAGLFRVLGVAISITLAMTLLLSWSISRPLSRLSRAAKRVAGGDPDVKIPTGGGGEITELGESFAWMKARLDARLRYIEGFAADVAHEFKSPLTSIRGAAELLAEGADSDPDARPRFLRNIELDVRRLDRLVSRLLELSRIEASSDAMTAVDLPALLRRVALRVGTTSNPVTVHPASSMGVVRGREADLVTAFLNILENGIRFSPPGLPIEVTITEDRTTTRVTFEDHGPGIPAAILPRIFDRFFTTDEARDGTGLGLSIAKSVVTAHGGEIQVESPPGRGATFVVVLPTQK